MWAICGSVGFAACAIAALLKRLRAAIAALNRTNMLDTPVTPVARCAPAGCWCTGVGWRGRAEVPGILRAIAEPRENGFGQPLAPATGEGERFHDHGADLAFHIVTQQVAGTVQAGLHRLRLQSENFRGLLDIHALDHAGDEDEPERLGEFIDRALDNMLDFTLGHGFFRIVA